ncbi:MAG: hypothetical protein ABIJ46_05410 [bacterium]
MVFWFGLVGMFISMAIILCLTVVSAAAGSRSTLIENTTVTYRSPAVTEEVKRVSPWGRLKELPLAAKLRMLVCQVGFIVFFVAGLNAPEELFGSDGEASFSVASADSLVVSSGRSEVTDRIDRLFLAYRVSDEAVSTDIGPVQLSEWLVRDSYRFVDDGGTTEVDYFYAATLAARGRQADVVVLTFWLQDLYLRPSYACTDDGRLHLRGAALLAIREMWPIDEAALNAVVRLSQESPPICSGVVVDGNDYGGIIRYRANLALRSWRVNHPSGFSAMMTRTFPDR